MYFETSADIYGQNVSVDLNGQRMFKMVIFRAIITDVHREEVCYWLCLEFNR